MQLDIGPGAPEQAPIYSTALLVTGLFFRLMLEALDLIL